MSYCVKCFGAADVYFGELEKVILSEYIEGIKKYSSPKWYCKDHTPKS